MTTFDKTLSNSHDSIAQRLEILTQLRREGEAYPNDFKRSNFSCDILENYKEYDHEKLEQEAPKACISGRVMRHRVMGKARFLDVQDLFDQVQVYVRDNEVEVQTVGSLYAVDLGDIVGIEGTIFRTKSGQLSLKASKFWLLTKSLRPLPDKYHGLQDTETRYRQRYLDLIANPKTREVFQKRSLLLKTIREFLNEKNFLEVETPMMQPIAGGALARPFITHHNTLDMPLYLRIAPELYLKRLVVGGFEQVYEINRNFRSEGLSSRHNPEFTMLEFYKAYSDYKDAMDLTEALLKYVTEKVIGDQSIAYQAETYSIAKPFKRFTVKEALLHYHPTLDSTILEDLHQLRLWVKNYPVDTQKSLGEIQFSLFEETVEKQLKEPTFITEHPIEVSPLARRNEQNPQIADRFELYIGGRELANGFSELNDPQDQARRFKEQLAAKESGDDEAMDYDEDYIKTLEYGLPPTAGVGVGIDRLMMLLADVPSIRDVILFPLVRPLEDIK